jgi:hypothetical protein
MIPAELVQKILDIKVELENRKGMYEGRDSLKAHWEYRIDRAIRDMIDRGSKYVAFYTETQEAESILEELSQVYANAGWVVRSSKDGLRTSAEQASLAAPWDPRETKFKTFEFGLK